MGDLGEKRVIAAVRTDEDFLAALDSGCECIFLLSSNILTIGDTVERAHSAGKKVFIHIDMSEGIGRDAAGVKYLSSVGADGVISTRTNIIRAAHECNLTSVQRIFAIDYQATKTSAEAAGAYHPSFIEIMPGVIPRVIKQFALKCGTPIIAGGLIETDEDIKNALEAGAIAVSTSHKNLW